MRDNVPIASIGVQMCSLTQLSKLSTLALSRNQLEGPLPFSLPRRIRRVLFDFNDLSGRVGCCLCYMMAWELYYGRIKSTVTHIRITSPPRQVLGLLRSPISRGCVSACG